MVLGYSNIKNALHTNIQPRDKTAAKELGELVGGCDTPTFMGQTNLRNLTYDTGKAIYINESGLYNLILDSKALYAKEFRDLVTRKILPDIRRYGEYNVNRDYLALKDKKCEEQTLVLQDKDRTIKRQAGIIQRTKAHIEFTKPIPKISAVSSYPHLNSIYKIGHIEVATPVAALYSRISATKSFLRLGQPYMRSKT